MPAPYEEMGYQTRLYVGTAGTTASTQVENALDVDYKIATQKGPTTDRGTGGDPPITTENVTQRGVTITWGMNNDPDNAQLLLFQAAAIVGAPISIKVVTGSVAVLFDGDVILEKDYDAPLAGSATYSFTAVPTKQSGRKPTLG